MTDSTAEARRSKWLRRPLYWVVVSLLLLIVVVIGIYIVGHHLNESKMDRQREAIESFVVPIGWEDVPHLGGDIHGPVRGSLWPCLAPAVFCNWHHTRTWDTASMNSATTMRAAAEASGWKEIDFSAEPPSTTAYSDACQPEGEGSYWCSLRAVSGGVSFELTVWEVHEVRGRRWWAILEAY